MSFLISDQSPLKPAPIRVAIGLAVKPPKLPCKALIGVANADRVEL